MPVLAVASLYVKRTAGALTRVAELRSATIDFATEVITGALSSSWAMTGPGILSWTMSVESIATVTNAGLAECVTALKNGEVLDIEALMGDGRRLSGSALCTSIGRGGAAAGVFATSLDFVGSTKLVGVFEAAYPTAPINLAVDSVGAGTVTLSWDEVVGIDGYYVHYGPSSGAYPFSKKIPVGDLADSANPVNIIGGLTARTWYFVVTSYEVDAPGVLESVYSSQVSGTST